MVPARDDLMRKSDSSARRPAVGGNAAGSEPSSANRGEPAQADAARADDSPVEETGVSEPTRISRSAPIAKSAASLDGLSTEELATALAGQTLGPVRLEHFVGGGGMGAVFRGLDTELNRTVAVKVLSTRQVGDGESLRRFKVEAQSAARLDHENIARVYYVGQDLGVRYIVFEYIDGINIRDLVNERGPLPVEDAVGFTFQIAEALAHACRRNVVHRDIKPSNVLVDEHGRAKLVDMGLARVHRQDRGDQDLTASGVTLGTFDYISPEQARDPRSADVRSDLYSLGCTLFFMLTGQPPFPGGTVLQKLLQHQADQAPDLQQFRADVPETVVHVVDNLLAKSPADRYQDPDALLADLLPLARQYGVPAAKVSANVWPAGLDAPEPFWRRHLPWIAPTVLLVGSALALDWLPGPSRLTGPVAVTPGGTAAAKPGKRPKTPAAPPPVGSSTAAPAVAAAAAAAPKAPVSAPAGEATVSGAGESAASASDKPDGLQPAAEAAEATEAVAESPANQSRTGDQPTSPAEVGGRETPATPPPEAAPTESVGSNGAGSSRTKESGAGPAPARRPVEPPVPPVPPATEPNEPGTIVVAAEVPAGAEATFSSLRAALDAARSGDVVELRFDGVQKEKPFTIANKRLTIRAGQGFAPQLLFQPGPEELGRVPNLRSMITVLGGHLTLVNLQIELVIPPGVVADGVSLVETRSAKSVRLDRCWLTIRNPADDQAVAFFDVRATLDKQLPRKEDGQDSARAVKIRLEHCVLRGEATLLVSREMQPIDLFWQNGLLVSSQRLLEVESSETPHPAAGAIALDLQYVTAHCRRGLLLARYAGGAPLARVEIACSDSILVADEDAALLEIEGGYPAAQLRETLVWHADRSFYERLSTFWVLNPAGEAAPDPLLFEPWREYWQAAAHGHENSPHYHAVVWDSPPPLDKPPHEHILADYLLDEREAGQPALHGAADGGRVGFRLDNWPAEPEPRPANAADAPATDKDQTAAGSSR